MGGRGEYSIHSCRDVCTWKTNDLSKVKPDHEIVAQHIGLDAQTHDAQFSLALGHILFA